MGLCFRKIPLALCGEDWGRERENTRLKTHLSLIPEPESCWFNSLSNSACSLRLLHTTSSTFIFHFRESHYLLSNGPNQKLGVPRTLFSLSPLQTFPLYVLPFHPSSPSPWPPSIPKTGHILSLLRYCHSPLRPPYSQPPSYQGNSHTSFTIPNRATSLSSPGPVCLWSLDSCPCSPLPVHPIITSIPPELLNQCYALSYLLALHMLFPLPRTFPLSFTWLALPISNLSLCHLFVSY